MRTIGWEVRGRKAVEVVVRLRIVGQAKIGPLGKKLKTVVGECVFTCVCVMGCVCMGGGGEGMCVKK